MNKMKFANRLKTILLAEYGLKVDSLNAMNKDKLSFRTVKAKNQFMQFWFIKDSLIYSKFLYKLRNMNLNVLIYTTKRPSYLAILLK
jgi:hypothetical protein